MHDRAAPSQPDRARARLRRRHPELRGLPHPADRDQGGRIDYDVDPARAAGFYQAIRQYYPGLKDGAIEPGYAGIRPKIAPKGTQAADFVIQGPRDHGVPGLVNLFAIESPGLTASLALAEEVERALGQSLSQAA